MLLADVGYSVTALRQKHLGKLSSISSYQSIDWFDRTLAPIAQHRFCTVNPIYNAFWTDVLRYFLLICLVTEETVKGEKRKGQK